MNKNLVITTVSVAAVLTLIVLLHKEETYNVHLEKLKQEYAIKPTPSVDHSKLALLRQDFETPQDVTRACIFCHTERHKEIMGSSHWNWERTGYIEGRGLATIGKKNIINNFCIGAGANEQACAKCHIGFGMTNDRFDFSNAANVDCMVCHDNSEEYLKGSSMAGYPDRSVNLRNVALSVGSPRKSNCGACHFYGGGGNNVKHGDLEESLLACDREVDVHMAANGMDMSCVTCHSAENHVMKGRLYSVSADNKNRAFCEDCHTDSPHLDNLLNRHTRVACQTCHIPHYAKVNATKMEWKWSEAGRLEHGKPYSIENEDGKHIYLSTKGEFLWEKNVIPDYIWFNGTADHYLLGDTVGDFPVVINPLNGSYDDKRSQIIPVKVHRGDQIYDRQTRMLVQPKLFGTQKGDSAFWQDFDWALASEAGMNRVGLPFSGDYKFVETEMYWPVNHMVSPKDKSLDCAHCHVREGGRLAGLGGFYLPGRDRNSTVDMVGKLILYLSIIAVLIHTIIRIVVLVRERKSVVAQDDSERSP
ncbi:MAG: tetrathionate reductase family octaheme c-type cytochrome [Candidatus Zixiibacteriota bacterium]|nr:MAG: tetrathionate reductase family octaheme c-type cytochrome [candidate division Zixibacteria bacterium]